MKGKDDAVDPIGEDSAESPNVVADGGEIQPLNYDLYLETDVWTVAKKDVMTYVPIYIEIENPSYNRGAIWAKIVDENGNQIGNPKLIDVGAVATMDKVSAFTKYSLMFKAYTLPGSYYIIVK